MIIPIILRISTVVFAVLFLILIILGIVIRGKDLTEFSLLIVGGIAGIASSCFGFVGSFYNKENSNSLCQKISSILIVIFFIIQIILHVWLIFAGLILVEVKDVLEIVEVLSSKIYHFSSSSDDFSFAQGVGYFTIVVGALVAFTILIAVIHMGFDFLTKIYASSVSMLHLAAAVFFLILTATIIKEYFIFKFYLPYILEIIFLTLTAIVGLLVALRRFKIIAQWIERSHFVIAIISIVGLVYMIGTVAHDRSNLKVFYDDLCISSIKADSALCEKWLSRMHVDPYAYCNDTTHDYCTTTCTETIGPENVNPCVAPCMQAGQPQAVCSAVCGDATHDPCFVFCTQAGGTPDICSAQCPGDPNINLCVVGCMQNGGSVDLCSGFCGSPNTNPYWGLCFDTCGASYLAQCPASVKERAMDKLEEDLRVVCNIVIFMSSYLLALFVITTTISIVFSLLLSPSKDVLSGSSSEMNSLTSLHGGGGKGTSADTSGYGSF